MEKTALGSSIGDRLRQVRESRFVGRLRECDLFRSAIAEAERPFQVMHVHGPGGIGKTSLLREFLRVCRGASIPSYYLDARTVEPSPDSFLQGLRVALELDREGDPLDYLRRTAGPQVILLDTCEQLLPLDGWLHEDFMTRLPEEVTVVLASREPPQAGWRSDPGWQSLMRPVALRNLSPEESREYLARRAVPDKHHPAMFAFTHGHPLALSLAADAYAQDAAGDFSPDRMPDLIRTLMQRFVQHVPDDAHRAALEASALVWVTTEPLLAAMVGAADAHGLFDWLRQLSFMESGRTGVFPHDLAREILSADLRWRNPERFADMHRRAREYFGARLQATSGQEQRGILTEYIFLHRENPMVRPFFEWQFGAPNRTEPARPADLDDLREMVRLHEGPESARWLEFWFERQRDRFLVARDETGKVAGFVLFLDLAGAAEKDLCLDPGTRPAVEYLRERAPLRAGDAATHFRFWMARESYQQVSPMQSLLVVHIVQHYLTTEALAYTFIPCADPEFWLPAYTYADLTRVPEADFAVGGRSYGVYGHDWRKTPPFAWLALLAEREIAMEPVTGRAEPAPAETLLVLSREEFDSAVRAALRSYTKPDRLKNNPLLTTRLVTQRAASASRRKRVDALRRLIHEAAGSMKPSPREVKLLRALHFTYLAPLETQELVAERLKLPFSTYRRHLVRGVSRLSEILWSLETGE